MVTYTSHSDTSFSLKWEIENFDQTIRNKSDPTKHAGVEWFIIVRRSADNNNLAIFLGCGEMKGNGWEIQHNTTIKVWKNDGTSVSTRLDKPFDCDHKTWGYDNVMALAELVNGYIRNGKITIEFVIKIESITGIRPERKHDFYVNDPKLSDVALKVEGRSLYVSKHMLSCLSPVFYAMFNSNFKEKKQKVIELTDDKHAEFEQFLQLLYQSSVEIDASNVGYLLALADKYNTPMITERCESFLLTTTQLKTCEKLKHAETYGLYNAVKTVINAIGTLPEYEAACVEVEQRDKKTMVGLIHRGIAMMKKMVVPKS